MLTMERLPLSQSPLFHSSYNNYFPLSSPSTVGVQSPKPGMPAGSLIQGLPSPPVLHHSATSHSKPASLRLCPSSNVPTPPPYDTAGSLIAAAGGSHCNPVAGYSPTGLQSSPHLHPTQSSRTLLDHHSHHHMVQSPTCDGGVLNIHASGHHHHPSASATSTTTAGSSSEGVSGVTSPRESTDQPLTVPQGEQVLST